MPVTLQALTGYPPELAGPAVPVLHPDDGPELHLDADDLTTPGSVRSAFWPLPPELPYPPPAGGRIVWPCWGATRWAVGHLLVRGADLASLRAVADWTGLVEVRLEDGLGGPAVRLWMVVAAARPVADSRAEADPEAAPDGYQLLTLADSRFAFAPSTTWLPNATIWAGEYQWEWGGVIRTAAKLGGGFLAGFTQTAAEINDLLTAGGFTPDYPGPVIDPRAAWWNTYSLSNWRESYFAFLDAACAQVNLRAWFGEAGVGEVQGAADAGTALSDWWAGYGGRSESGGRADLAAGWPLVMLSFHPRLTGGAFGSPLDGTPYSPPVGNNLFVPEAADPFTPPRWPAAYLDVHHPAQATGADAHDFQERYRDDVGRWLAAGSAECVLAGWVPLPTSSCVAWCVYDTREGTTALHRPEGFWPWPLVGGVPAFAEPPPASPPVPPPPPPPPPPPGDGQILGSVADETGDPLPARTLTLAGTESGSTTTDATGAYSFTALTPGPYTVTITLSTGEACKHAVDGPPAASGAAASVTVLADATHSVDFRVAASDGGTLVVTVDLGAGYTVSWSGGGTFVESPAGTHTLTGAAPTTSGTVTLTGPGVGLGTTWTCSNPSSAGTSGVANSVDVDSGVTTTVAYTV